MMMTGKKIGLALCAVVIVVLLAQIQSDLSTLGTNQPAGSDPARDTEAHQRNLAKWQSMAESRRLALREAFDRYQTMPPEQQEELRRRYRWYEQLPEAERRLVQANFELVTSVSKDELATLNRLYTRYQRMPEDKQRKVEQFYRQFRKRSVADQRAFLQGVRAAGSLKEKGEIVQRWLRQTRPVGAGGPTSQKDDITEIPSP